MASLVYLDSCAVLAFLKNEPERASTVQTALRHATLRPDDLTLRTSVLTIAEVAYLTASVPTLQSEFIRIDVLWHESPIERIETNEVHARLARDLLRQRAVGSTGQVPGARRRSIDALHLASAITFGCDEFWTYDVDDFRRYGSLTIDIREPHVDQLPLL